MQYIDELSNRYRVCPGFRQTNHYFTSLFDNLGTNDVIFKAAGSKVKFP